MADTAIKPEIKLDPATSTPPTMADLEEFEDDVDLHVPPTDGHNDKAWLVKVPRELWGPWMEMYQAAGEEPVQIGTMRVFEKKPGEDMQRTQILLKEGEGLEKHKGIPQKYNLNWNTGSHHNTTVFSVKDLPGRQNQPPSRANSSFNNKPTGVDKNSRYPPGKPGTYRSAIPKQTALAPQIHHVADAVPAASESDIISAFTKEYAASLHPKSTTTYQPFVEKGSTINHGSFSAFNTSRPGAIGAGGLGGNRRGAGKASAKEKAVRISTEALTDALYNCFKQYQYWSLKALRHHLRQPEAFIKQTLEGIATLVRSGDFAMNYVLKPEFAGLAEVEGEEKKGGVAEVKSESEGEDGEDEGDGEGEDEFEDVKMEGTGDGN